MTVIPRLPHPVVTSCPLTGGKKSVTAHSCSKIVILHCANLKTIATISSAKIAEAAITHSSKKRVAPSISVVSLMNILYAYII